MKILFYQWHSFMNQGIERAFSQLHMDYDTLFFQQVDWEKDEGLGKKLSEQLSRKSYDMVFSVNFAPVVSEVCKNKGIQYVSWVYDAPLHIRNTEPLKNTCNRIFFFDRMQADGYAAQGVNAYYMPLAGDVETFGGAKQFAAGARAYQTDIALVGKLYQTDYAYYCSPLSNFQRGYLDGILNAQSKVYGGYFLDEMLDEALLAELNQSYAKASGGKVSITKEELEFMMACEITGRERYLALALLSKYYRVDLYSGDRDTRLEHVNYKGYADYYRQMPGIFKGSRINLNISLKIIRTGIPLRVFDVLACGGFLLTNFQAEMPEYFTLGEDFAVYESVEDLYEKTDFYLRHDTERERIARHGFETVSNNYTFRHQLEKILHEIK